MQAFLNGRIVPEDQAVVPVSDRGLLYGDGLFETLGVRLGCPVWWGRHLQRLEAGAAFLQIPMPAGSAELHQWARQLISDNGLPDAVLRILLTRGSGPRGYSTQGTTSPTLVMTVHARPAPCAGVRLVTSSFRLPAVDPVARFKTTSRLLSVLARAEAQEHGGDEALLLNHLGSVAEAAAGNLFWVEGDTLCTPPVSAGALPGVIRSVLLELLAEQRRPGVEKATTPEALSRAEGIFLTNSVTGILPVSMLDGRPVPQSEQTSRFQALLQEKELLAGIANP